MAWTRASRNGCNRAAPVGSRHAVRAVDLYCGRDAALDPRLYRRSGHGDAAKLRPAWPAHRAAGGVAFRARSGSGGEHL